MNKLDNRTRDKIIRKRSTSSNNKQISPSFNSPRSSEILTQLHSSPWWNSIRRHNFRPRKFTYPEPRLALKFRDTPPSDLDKIHLLSTKIHRDRSRSRRPNEVLSPLKQRERGLPRIESDGVSPKPPPPLFRRWLPRWHFRLRGTSNEKPHAQCRVRRQTGLFAYHRGGWLTCSSLTAILGRACWSLIARSSNVPRASCSRVRWLKKKERKGESVSVRWFKGDDDRRGGYFYGEE